MKIKSFLFSIVIFVKGIVLRNIVKKPKKPNSANRKVNKEPQQC